MKISAAMQPSELGDVNIFSIFVDFDFFTISSFQEFFSECSPFLPRTTYKTNKRRKTISFPRRSHKSQPYYSLAQPKQGVYKNKRRKLCKPVIQAHFAFQFYILSLCTILLDNKFFEEMDVWACKWTDKVLCRGCFAPSI